MQTAEDRGGPFSLLAKWWRNWTARDAALRELGCCDSQEAAHIARDVGVSAYELQTLAGRWPEPRNLLERRMAASGLNVERVAHSEPQVLRDLQRVCGQCEAGARCRRDLDAQDLGEDRQDRLWRDYCPNVVTLDALRTEDRDHRLMRRRGRRQSAFNAPPRS
jgi:hypothetical protein